MSSDLLMSQSPFSSGEVFHITIVVGLAIMLFVFSLNPLLVAGKYSTSYDRFGDRRDARGKVSIPF